MWDNVKQYETIWDNVGQWDSMRQFGTMWDDMKVFIETMWDNVRQCETLRDNVSGDGLLEEHSSDHTIKQIKANKKRTTNSIL